MDQSEVEPKLVQIEPKGVYTKLELIFGLNLSFIPFVNSAPGYVNGLLLDIFKHSCAFESVT